MIFSLLSCTETNKEGSEPEPPAPPKPEYELELTGKSFGGALTFTSVGGSDDITFITDGGDWKAELTGNPVDWCSISPISGTGKTGKIAVNVSENNELYERRAVVQITRGTIKRTVVITQKQKDSLLLSTNSVEVWKNGGIVTVQVQPNVDYTYTIPAQFTSWIKEEKKDANYIAFIVGENEDYEGREGYIVFSGAGLEETLHIKQAGGSRLLLSETKQHIGVEGGVLTVDVVSNCDFTVKIPDADWISVIDSRAMSSHTVYLKVAPYDEVESSRSAEVIITSADGEISEKIIISQYEEYELELTGKSVGGALTFTSVGGSEDITFVTDGGDWKAELTGNPVDWCSISPTSGTGKTGKITVKVSENKELDERRAVVQITRGTIKRTVIITQKQKNALLLSTNSVEVGKNGGIVTVQVQANVNYTYTIPSQFTSWIKEEKKLGANYFAFIVDENEDYEGREGYITFSGAGLEETLHIKQAGGSRLLLSETKQHVGAEGGVLTVDVVSNCDFTVKIPDADWISVIDSRAMSSHTVYLKVAPYDEVESSRSAEVTIASADGEISEKMTITQYEKNAIIISETELEAKSGPSTVSLWISANVEVGYTVSEGDGAWIDVILDSEKRSRAMSQQNLYLRINPNTTGERRQAKVTLYDLDNPTTQSRLTIKQNPIYLKIVHANPAPDFNDADSHTINYRFETDLENMLFEVDGNFEEFNQVRDVTRSNAWGATPNYYYDVKVRLKQNLNPGEKAKSYVNLICPPGWNQKQGTTIASGVVYQAAPQLAATKTEIALSDADVTLTLPFEANLPYTLEVDKSAASWIVFSDFDEYKRTYNANVRANTSSEPRTAVITARTANPAISATCTITQMGADLTPVVYNLTDDIRLSDLVDEPTLSTIRAMKIVGVFKTEDYEIITRMAKEGVLSSLDLSEARMKRVNNYSFFHNGALFSFLEPTELPDRMFWSVPLKNLELMDNITSIGLSAFRFCNVKELTIPASVTSLKNTAIENARLMKKLDMGQCVGLTKIPFGAVSECPALETVILPPNLESIENHAFSCASIDVDVDRSPLTINFPSSLISIGQLAFYRSGLVSVDIPEGVLSIGKSAFKSCKNMKSAIVRCVTADRILPKEMFDLCESLTHLEIAKGYEEIGESALNHTGPIENLVIPEGVTKLGRYAFGQSRIKSVKLPETLEIIGEGAFAQACWLEELTVPASVTTIGRAAFSCNWNGLWKLHLRMTEPPTLEGELFHGEYYYKGRQLYVPVGCKEKYQAVEPWNRFPDIIEE